MSRTSFFLVLGSTTAAFFSFFKKSIPKFQLNPWSGHLALFLVRNMKVVFPHYPRFKQSKPTNKTPLKLLPICKLSAGMLLPQSHHSHPKLSSSTPPTFSEETTITPLIQPPLFIYLSSSIVKSNEPCASVWSCLCVKHSHVAPAPLSLSLSHAWRASYSGTRARSRSLARLRRRCCCCFLSPCAPPDVSVSRRRAI